MIEKIIGNYSLRTLKEQSNFSVGAFCKTIDPCQLIDGLGDSQSCLEDLIHLE